jgi:hypothetical protein
MTKKPRVKKDAFDWVDSATDKEQVVEQPMQLQTESSNKVSEPQSTSPTVKSESATFEKQRCIFVAFNINTGDIMATQELMLNNVNDRDISLSGLLEDMTAKVFKLTGELADKEIIEIHSNYKVTESGKLELKQR